jgi:UDP-N-acetylglucosamine--N-acetylmuramyl-(pentapeptide) pyrophosphoryl-undecaprenol N-acetylglucosamine transferase
LIIRHRIILTGGGTGGHVYPALAVAEQLKDDPDVEALLYCGAIGHVEEQLTAERSISFKGLQVSGLPRSISLKTAFWPIPFSKAVTEAIKVLKDFRPTVVLGTGGYASAPPLVAALWLKVPFAIHEPDAHPGLVNRLMGPYAQLISLGMSGAKECFNQSLGRVRVNGNPVSKRFLEKMSRSEASKLLDVADDAPTVLVTGGSQGARALNEAVYAALPELLQSDKNIQVIHQVGEKNWQEMESALDRQFKDNPRYKPRPYFENLALAYAVSDLTVCRAGAMTISELCVTGTPAIFVPLPTAAQDHQTFNAQSIAATGAAKVLIQKDLGGQTLARLILETIDNKEGLARMAQAMKSMACPDAAVQLAGQLKRLSAHEPISS